MIRRVRIRNFQKHELLDLELGPITVLVGKSGSGKSSVIRALRWLCVNRPQGDSFVRSGSEACSVTALVRGKKVGRRKGPGKNSYSVDGSEFVSFGSKVPREVEEFLGLSADNWQGQHDAPYWFSLSKPEVSRKLNEVINLTSIDRSLSKSSEKVRYYKTLVQVHTDRIRSAQGTIRKLSWVKSARSELNRIKDLEKQVSELSETLLGLRQTHRDLSYRDKTLQIVQKALAAGLIATKGMSDFRRISEKLNRLRSIQSKWSKLQITFQPPDPSYLKERFSELSRIELNLRRLRSLSLGIAQLDYDTWNAEAEVDTLEKQIESLTGGRCPLCGSVRSRSHSGSETSTCRPRSRPAAAKRRTSG